MKKLKILFIVVILILAFLLGCFIGFKLYWKKHPLIEKDVSMLQCKVEIESDKVMVVIEPEEIIENEEPEQEHVETKKENTTTSNKKTNTSTSSQKQTTKVTQATAPAPVTYTPKIQISRTKVNLVIYSQMTVKNMEKGVVILETQNGLNQPGNTVISGHNYVNGRLFSNNEKIQLGDLITITDSSGTKITYSVYNKYHTDPNDAGYMDIDTEGRREIALTTCTPDSSERIIIQAREI